jgi:hypothetical protein
LRCLPHLHTRFGGSPLFAAVEVLAALLYILLDILNFEFSLSPFQ